MPNLRQRLRSSALTAMEYDPETETLELTFSSGDTYSYEGVPARVAEGLARASSPGRYYHDNIKDLY